MVFVSGTMSKRKVGLGAQSLSAHRLQRGPFARHANSQHLIFRMVPIRSKVIGHVGEADAVTMGHFDENATTIHLFSFVSA